MWRNWNPCTLLVGIYSGVSIIENSVEIPQSRTKQNKTKQNKTELQYDPAITLLGI